MSGYDTDSLPESDNTILAGAIGLAICAVPRCLIESAMQRNVSS